MTSVLRWGSSASILVGLGYLLTALAFLGQPAALRGAASPHDFWLAMADGSALHLAVHWLSAATGLVGLAVVPAVLRLVRGTSEGLALWASALAYLGFAVAARSHLMELELDLRIAPLYESLPAATQAAVPLIAGLALDVPHGVLTMGGAAVWVIVASWLGHRGGDFSLPFAALGFALGLSFLAAVAGFSLLLLPLVTLGVGLGGVVLAPLWFVGLGRLLHRLAVAEGR